LTLKPSLEIRDDELFQILCEPGQGYYDTIEWMTNKVPEYLQMECYINCMKHKIEHMNQWLFSNTNNFSHVKRKFNTS
jgi:hypothetical protein